ncbi:hypothetical protein QWY99_10245 [Flavobacterium branchiarum]|uniref:Uncharacterized protein n=1 Tax=Flavobacterium branchiarum TaxID=1114870 RepID=A0ABV5FRZ2_9FLAO|nr:hypothetical protein [Flavobacterium branchiarum]MDN3673432.1 hypothetical protein [Flavobacterium branchiarum]
MKNQCQDCHYFNGDRHKNDPRTEHAGICSKWCEVVPKKDTCNQFFAKSNLTEQEIFKPLIDVAKLPPANQLNLFN